MSIRIAIEHRTEYRFDSAVRLGPHVVRLRPAPHCRTPILSYSLQVTPAQHFLNWQQDPFGNHLARLVFPDLTSELSVTVDLVADMTVINPFDFFVEDSAREWPFAYDDDLARDLAPYLEVGEPGTLQAEWLSQIAREPTPINDFLVALNRRVFADVSYSVRMQTGVQTPEQTLAARNGSCRDSAWLLVDTLRRLGLAARFASGYLVQLAPDPDAQPLNGPPGPTEDFTDLHAWAETYVPGAGWIGLDATSGLLAGEGHIPLACTPRPSSAAPITGTAGPARTTLSFTNEVRRVHERPRVTRPYGDHCWTRIDELGEQVDEVLDEADVRLTMGGEPTFVSIDDTEAPEWNVAALGPTKLAFARRLADELAARFAPGALIRHGQGKWYPGEELPRWQIGVHWRIDGQPLWGDPTLLADPAGPGHATVEQLERLVEALAAELGLPGDVALAAREDPLDRLATEAGLPAGEPPTEGVDALDAVAIADARARAAAIDALNADGGEPAGYAIPLHRSFGDARWTTGYWTLRRGALYLVPGDSPMGLRLPLSAIAWAPPPPLFERSAFAPATPLRQRAAAVVLAGAAAAAANAPETDEPEMAEPPPITALCVELRDGHVHVFLPPLEEGAHAVELIAAVEAAAASTDQPVIVEGYAPPPDPQLDHFDVTPDPGVIEVNIHPSRGWRELSDRTTALYEAARGVGLGSEKFALDGTHTATGGGSHLTLGGPTPRDSPMLRRPDLLRSLITFWQNHPSLSYLFSGRFVGPTSQAPRVDEGRHEALYELEIAFGELERLARLGAPPPWQVDRLLRNLLVDITGNTHRAEFCVDKLFDPDSANAGAWASSSSAASRCRRTRAWPSSRRCSCERSSRASGRRRTPVRSCAGARSCTTASCSRGGWRPTSPTSLADLQAHGFAFAADWLTPFLEFRFPRIGEVVVGDVAPRAAYGDRAVERARRGARRGDRALRRLLAGAAAGPRRRPHALAPRGHL